MGILSPESSKPDAPRSLANVPGNTGRPRSRRSLSNLLNASAVIGALIVLVVLVLAIGAPWLGLHDPMKQDVTHALQLPAFQGGDWTHPLGTDSLGRDLLARIVWGLRPSLVVAICAVAVTSVLGLTAGTFAGYFGGTVETLLMRLADVQMAFPFIILAITILSITPPSPVVLVLVLSLSGWPVYARVMRSTVMVESKTDYVLVAKAMGASNWRIITRYIVRNILPSLLVMSTLDIATMIIFESALSFMGMGIQPPTPSLGNIMADGKNYLALGAWWITTLPGVAILFCLLGLNLLGDSLRSNLDPRFRRT